MIVYKDIISGDELFTDVYKIKECPGGIFYEVEGKTITRTEGFDESLISANASAEEAPEATDASSISGVDIILNSKLQETSYDKKGYITHMRDYVKAVRAKLEETNPKRVQGFVDTVQPEVKKLLQKFSDFQFFTGESMNPEAMVALLDYKEDGTVPYMLFFKDGLIVEKF